MTPNDINRFAEDLDPDALLAGHALGDLDERERQQLAELLQRKPGLRQRLEEYRTTLELLPLALPATAEPPDRLRRRILDRPAARRPAPVAPSTNTRPWAVPALLGILGTALLLLGVELHQTRHQLAEIQHQLTRREGVQTAEHRMPLRSIDPAGRATGEVLVTGNPTHNVLMVNDLPPPPPNHIYRLWAEVQGREVGCVYFVPTAQGHVSMLIPTSPTSQATSVSVSVEADPLGQAPKGPRVLSSRI